MAPPNTWLLGKRGQHGDSTGSLSPVPLGKHHGAVNPCRLPPCARAPFGAGAASCSWQKGGEQKGSVAGAHKRQEAAPGASKSRTMESEMRTLLSGFRGPIL